MKLKSFLSMSLLAAAASLSFATYAANDADKPQADTAQADKPAAKKMQPHSHMQEKNGVGQQEPSTKTKGAKTKADKDNSKHYHPRDGK